MFVPLLHRNVQWFRGGLVFKANRLCVSLNSRLESNKEAEEVVRFTKLTCRGVLETREAPIVLKRTYTKTASEREDLKSFRTLTSKPRLKSGLDCLICAMFARQRIEQHECRANRG